MSVPSSDHRYTWPWPKPLAMASTRMSMSTHSVGTRWRDAQRVVEAVAAGRLAERLADAERHVVAEHGERRRPTGRAGRGCGPTATSARSADRTPSRSIGLRAEASRTSIRRMIESSTSRRNERASHSSGRGTVGRRRPRALGRDVPGPEGGLDGEDLGVADVGDGPGLGDRLAGDRHDHVDVHHRRRAGVGEVLGGGPDERSTGGRLQRLDRGGQTAAAEQEHVPGAEAGHHRQVPAVRVVGRLEAEELAGVHAKGNLRRRLPYLLLPCPTPPGPETPARSSTPSAAGSALRSRSWRPRWPPSRPATSTPSPSSTPKAPGPGPRPRTSRSPSAACRSG